MFRSREEYRIMGHTPWSWRVRVFHDLYMKSYLAYVFIVLVAAVTNFVFFANGWEKDEFYSKWVMKVCNKLLYAQLVTQILTAKPIFQRCPLTLLEYQLRGEEDVKRYWVGRLPRKWSIGVLVGVTATLYLTFFWLFLLSGITPFP